MTGIVEIRSSGRMMVVDRARLAECYVNRQALSRVEATKQGVEAIWSVRIRMVGDVEMSVHFADEDIARAVFESIADYDGAGVGIAAIRWTRGEDGTFSKGHRYR